MYGFGSRQQAYVGVVAAASPLSENNNFNYIFRSLANYSNEVREERRGQEKKKHEKQNNNTMKEHRMEIIKISAA